MTKHFVWVWGLHGPEGQIWDDDHKSGTNKPYLFIKKLEASEANKTLDELKLSFPFLSGEAKP